MTARSRHGCTKCGCSWRRLRDMTQKKYKPVAVTASIRKLKQELKTNLPVLGKANLEALIEEAVVDAYGEEEQTVGFFTMIEEHLALPFSVSILGVEAVVE